MNLLEMIENRKREINNTEIDTTDADFLNEFDANVKSLCEKDFFDLVILFDMLYNNIGYDEASNKLAKVAYIFKTLFGEKEDYERVLAVMDMIYGVIEDYKDRLQGYTYKDFKRLNDRNIELEALQKLLDVLNKNCSVEEINDFLFWICDDVLSEVLSIAANLKGICLQLSLDPEGLEDLSDSCLNELVGARQTKKIRKGFVNAVNSNYLRDMKKEFAKELSDLANLKAKKQNEVSSLRRKITREIKSLDELEKDYLNKSLSLEKLDKYKLDLDIYNLALIELINLKNNEFKKTYEEVEVSRKNPINKLEVLFDKYGRNFNHLTLAEQDLLTNAYKFEFIAENLNFISTSSLKWLNESDEVFINILIQEIDVLMQIDSLFIRNKISKDFILAYGNEFNSLTVKILVHNVNKLDNKKVNLKALEEYDMSLLLKLNVDLFDVISLYGIDMSQDNLKNLEFLENDKLLDVIDKYIELGLVKQIQSLPNLIANSSNVVLKRINLMQQLDEDVLNSNFTLNQMARNGKDFYLGDDLLDDYIFINYRTFMDDDILEVLDSSSNIEILEELPDEISFIENYRKNDRVYMIGDNYFSRIKVLRTLKTLLDFGLTNYKELLFQCLIYNYPKYLSIDVIEQLKSLDDCYSKVK